MKKRCENKNNQAYRNYGARGISLYGPWSEDFWAFAADMPSKPSPELTIERINNDGDYAPGNVEWVSRVVQNRNRRTNRYLTAKGRTQLLMDWAAETGTRHSTILHRIKELGWSVEDAVTIPSGGSARARSIQKRLSAAARKYIKRFGGVVFLHDLPPLIPHKSLPSGWPATTETALLLARKISEIQGSRPN